MPSEPQLQLMALCKIPKIDWWLLAREAQRPGGLERLLQGELSETSERAAEVRVLLRDNLSRLDSLREEALASVRPALEAGAAITTVIDDDYPPNLRVIFDLPPFLLLRGKILPTDAWSVAVVGTRDASPEGLHRATRMATLLSERDVTVLSGLARGIDTAAHRAALDAGGRTVAVLGSGLNKVYPPENAALAEEIASHGAVVSQFWPDQSPARYTFPWRNRVTSGLGQGTVVIEATHTSGAKMQARLALEHGKKVFLIESLVREHEWARKYLDRGAIEVSTVDDVIRHLRPADIQAERSRQVHQEALAL